MRRPVSPAAKALTVAGAALPLVAAGVIAAGPAGAASSRTPIPGTVPSWATSSAEQGHAPATAAVQARVYLSPRNPDQLTALVHEVSDPASPSYRQFLSPADYTARFAPTADDVASVRQWLTGAGLHVDSVGAGNRYVAVSGNVQHADAAFGTELDQFRHQGQARTAPATTVTVPAGLHVLTVTGLDGPHEITPASQQPFPPPPAFVNARPCSDGYGDTPATDVPTFDGKTLPYAVCGYVPAQLRAAYGSAGLDGSGATVAITDAYAAGTILDDADTYATRHGDPAFTSGQFSQVLPQTFTKQELCGGSGWYGEETLDVEAVHAIAPAANVIYYGAASCYDADFLDTLARVVDDHKASIVTNSWSDLEANETPAGVAAYEAIFQQGAAEGIGFFFSSGDNGDEQLATGTRQVDYPAADPYVTAVGGTALAVTGTDAAPVYGWETGWGTDKYSLTSSGDAWTPIGTDANGFLYGAGGGASSLFPAPGYQQQAGVGTAHRMVPDIGLDADPTTGMLVGETQTFPQQGRDVTAYGEYRIGGTSLASPLMAGVQALATQAAGGPLGFANPTLYALYAKGHSSALRDIAGDGPDAGNVRIDYANGLDDSSGYLYSVRTFDDDSSLTTSRGWDDVTGVGSPTSAYPAAVAGGTTGGSGGHGHGKH